MENLSSCNLLTYRKTKGMTQEELAERSGITARTIQRIESGQVTPQVHTLKVLANCLGVTLEDLNRPSVDSNISPPAMLQMHTGLLAVMHITPLIGIYFPLMNIVAPLIIWLLKKDAYHIFDEQGRKLINFQITLSLIGGLAIIIMVLYFPLGYPGFIACNLFAIIMAIYNMIAVLKHRKIHYPLSIKFI